MAIRTIALYADGEAVLNVGGGVVADSTAEAEYEEALWKARFADLPGLKLIETFRWQPGTGFVRLPAHLARLARVGGGCSASPSTGRRSTGRSPASGAPGRCGCG